MPDNLLTPRRWLRFGLRTMFVGLSLFLPLLYGGTQVYRTLHPPVRYPADEAWSALQLNGSTHQRQTKAERLGIDGPLDFYDRRHQLEEDLHKQLRAKEVSNGIGKRLTSP